MLRSSQPSFEEKTKEWLYKDELPKIVDKNVKYTIDRNKKGIDFEIAKALKKEPSKKGGNGGGIPDTQILIKTPVGDLPILIELKGTRGKLSKYTKNGLIELYDENNQLNLNSISNYATNGAVFYARNVLKNTSKFDNILAVGINGFLENDNPKFEVDVCLLNINDYELPIHLGKYNDLSFLYPEFIPETLKKISVLLESPKEKELRIMDEEARYTKVLQDLNQQLHENDHIAVGQRVDLVVGSIMAGLGNKDVKPLKLEKLVGSDEEGETDGDIVLNKIKNFLKSKRLPEKKVEQVVNQLSITFINSENQVVENETNETPIKQVYRIIHNEVIPLLKDSQRNDFMGQLFNTMYKWVAVPDGDKNDVVLTPRYVANLMGRLAKVNMNSYVWDWALGSGGLLISAMNLMLDDAQKNLKDSLKKLNNKIENIKSQQLLGIEKLPNVYVLAVLNMILMGDGSTNILQKNSLKYDGKYAYEDKTFEATVFLVNPPYSAEGNGMIFLEKALEKMQSKGKRAVIIIQDSAGKGKAEDINKRILKHNTLIASIKMPTDIFPNSIQTSIYVFNVGEKHNEKQQVKFLDFRNDGYLRSNRKNSNSNLIDDDHAYERYNDLIDIVNYGKTNSEFFKKGINYIEDTIDPESGRDWNWENHINNNGIDEDDDSLQKTLNNYLSWSISQSLQNRESHISSFSQKVITITLNEIFDKVKTTTSKYKNQVRKLKKINNPKFELPALTSGIINQGLTVKIPRENETVLRNVISVSANGKNSGTMFYQPNDFAVLQDAYAIKIKKELIENPSKYHYLYLLAIMNKSTTEYDWSNKATWDRVKNIKINVPANEKGKIDFEFMEKTTKRMLLDMESAIKQLF